jgi:hypothetical protein
VLDEWTAALTQELGIDIEVDSDALLDLARDAAHNVARPAAPLSTFLVGFAAARAGGSDADVAQAIETARLLALRWSPSVDPS